ncbi:DUF134 domain-containing protein [Clostridium sporogenes]|uniref:DUF134 domain-containing protein n=1 Tax=Clostridium sporogenes TaxID=1509 RepID=UPI003CC80D56
MARPTKFRKVEFFPESNYFVPWGKPKCQIEEIFLKVEELEAIRLKDIEKLTQEECAQKMDISRQTFQNIIDAARNKVAIALTEGKAIRITGGHYTTKLCKVNFLQVNLKCLKGGSIIGMDSKCRGGLNGKGNKV